MANRTFKHRGMQVEVWEQSFRLEGMHRPLHIGPDMQDDQIKELIDSIYRHVLEKAVHEAKTQVSADLKRKVNEMVFG